MPTAGTKTTFVLGHIQANNKHILAPEEGVYSPILGGHHNAADPVLIFPLRAKRSLLLLWHSCSAGL
jgi:hypothetical protein